MTALRSLPVRHILRVITDSAGRWADADFPARVRALDRIANRTGYSIPTVEYALDRLFQSLTQAQLEAAICDELGSLDALDGFVERSGRPPARAVPAGRACIISSRTTIGVALVPAAFALCAKCAVVIKDREDHFVDAFFATLAQEDAAFAQAAIAQPWEGDAFDLRPFSVVFAFGRDETLQSIRSQCAPEARFVGFGASASAGYVTRDALRDEEAARRLAAQAARDLILYEGEGCLSLHALFVERGGRVEADRFAALLAAAVERSSIEFPVGTREAQALAGIGYARALAEFRAASGVGQVFSDQRGMHLIVADPPRSQPPFFLPRALGVLPVDSPTDASEYLATHGIRLEALATDRNRPDIANLAIQAGAARITAFGQLQSPLVAANHGGRARISDFVRWITDET